MPIRAVDDAVGDGVTLAPVSFTRKVITYGTAMVLNPNEGTHFSITVTDGVAFSITPSAPGPAGKLVLLTLRNTSGGALGAVTLASPFKIAATAIAVATAFSRTYVFISDGTNLVEVARGAADVAN